MRPLARHSVGVGQEQRYLIEKKGSPKGAVKKENKPKGWPIRKEINPQCAAKEGLK